jgi:hypothetical protein
MPRTVIATAARVTFLINGCIVIDPCSCAAFLVTEKECRSEPPEDKGKTFHLPSQARETGETYD